MYRRFAIVGLAIAVFATVCSAQAQNAQQPALTPQELLAKTVAFITVPYKHNGKAAAVNGTCFFVAMPDERLGKDQSFLYVVTNRHVAAPTEADSGSLSPLVVISMNRAQAVNGNVAIQFPIVTGPSLHWYFPQDKTVDLAVLPTGPNPKVLDFKAVPVSLFATDDVIKSQHITIGDEVFFAGYFFQFPGSERFEPIMRHGTVAMMPDEPVPMRYGDPSGEEYRVLEHLYLADAHGYRGNSGSPLFVQLGGFRNGVIMAGSSYMLLGVVNGFIPESADIQATGAVPLENKEEPNSGVSTFVPAEELKQLLDSPELKKLRDDAVAAGQKQTPARQS